MFEKLPIKRMIKPDEFLFDSGYSLDWSLVTNLTRSDDGFKRDLSRGTHPLTKSELHDFRKLYRVLAMRHRRLFTKREFLSQNFIDHIKRIEDNEGLVQPYILFLSLFCDYSGLSMSFLLNSCAFDYLLFSYNTIDEHYAYHYGCMDYRNDKVINIRVEVIDKHICIPTKTFERISREEYFRLSGIPSPKPTHDLDWGIFN